MVLDLKKSASQLSLEKIIILSFLTVKFYDSLLYKFEIPDNSASLTPDSPKEKSFQAPLQILTLVNALSGLRMAKIQEFYCNHSNQLTQKIKFIFRFRISRVSFLKIECFRFLNTELI